MDKTHRLLLRVAATATLLFAAGHMLGAASSWSPMGETPVLQSMREFSFEVSGATRTYWHFYYGFGVYIGLLLAVQAITLWQFASLPFRAIQHILATIAVAWMVGTAILWHYIFVVPAVFSLVCTTCIVAALLSGRRQHEEG